MKLPYTICYTSVGNNISEEEVDKIFEVTSQFNQECEIAGLLLYSKETNRFFQVLEGSKKEVRDLYYDKIKDDSRHKEIIEIFDRPTSKPVFLKYSSKFNLVKTDEDLAQIKKYINENRHSRDNAAEIARLMEPFFLFYH